MTRNAIFALSNVTFSDGDLSLIKICVTIVTLLGSRFLARQLCHGLGNLKAKCSRLHLVDIEGFNVIFSRVSGLTINAHASWVTLEDYEVFGDYWHHEIFSGNRLLVAWKSWVKNMEVCTWYIFKRGTVTQSSDVKTIKEYQAEVGFPYEL